MNKIQFVRYFRNKHGYCHIHELNTVANSKHDT